MKNKLSWMAMGWVAGLLAVNLLITGCESTSSADQVIKLTPESAELRGKGATASFTAAATSTNSPLVLPLEWSLSRGDFGRVLSAEGVTAIYESNGSVGNNTITVKDKIGQSGVAVINQLAPIVSNAPPAAGSSTTAFGLPGVDATLP